MGVGWGGVGGACRLCGRGSERAGSAGSWSLQQSRQLVLLPTLSPNSTALRLGQGTRGLRYWASTGPRPDVHAPCHCWRAAVAARRARRRRPSRPPPQSCSRCLSAAVAALSAAACVPCRATRWGAGPAPAPAQRPSWLPCAACCRAPVQDNLSDDEEDFDAEVVAQAARSPLCPPLSARLHSALQLPSAARGGPGVTALHQHGTARPSNSWVTALRTLPPHRSAAHRLSCLMPSLCFPAPAHLPPALTPRCCCSLPHTCRRQRMTPRTRT